jgi:hypothetical protein
VRHRTPEAAVHKPVPPKPVTPKPKPARVDMVELKNRLVARFAVGASFTVLEGPLRHL